MGFELEPEEFIGEGDYVIVVLMMRGTGRGSGVTVEERIAHQWKVRDGKAVALQVYSDPDDAVRDARAALSRIDVGSGACLLGSSSSARPATPGARPRKRSSRRGERPVLAGRSAERLASLAADLGGLETAVADVAQPQTVNEIVERGDVLVATVGPFVRFGRPAVEAAIDRGAHYLDSTGEPPFIREVFERYGPGAARARAWGS